MSDMRILVTGAAGRVGRAIHVHLARRMRVQGLDRAPASNVHWHGELDDAGLLRAALSGVQAVVHTAALHAPHVGCVADAEFRRINVEATQRLYESAAAAGVQRFVFTSTTALYGDAVQGDAAAWLDEDTPPRPRTVYHHSKLAAETWLTAAARQGGPAVRILRMSRCFPEPVATMAVQRLHRGIDARDVARAHAAALRHPGPPVALFVISGATPFQREDAAALGHEAAGVLQRRAPALCAAFAARGWSLPDRIDRVCVPHRAEAALPWRAAFGFEEVLRQYDEESSEVLPPGLHEVRGE